MRDLRRMCTRFLVRHGLLSLDDRRWIFVIGCYNSGTTLLQRILGRHPAVASMSVEGQTVTDAFVQPKEVGLPRLWALEPDRFHLTEDAGDGHLARRVKRDWGAAMDDPLRPYLLEKSVTNSARIRWLHRHFPHCHFVAIVRDGYAVAEGIRRKTGRGLDEAAKQWRVSNEIMLADLEHVPSSATVTYESLTADPEEALDPVFRLIGLPPLPSATYSRTWSVHGHGSKIVNMNPRSYENLTSQDLRVIESVAGETLRRLGYREPGADPGRERRSDGAS